jgi:ferredoxin
MTQLRVEAEQFAGETWVNRDKCIGCGYSSAIAPEVYTLGSRVTDRVAALRPDGSSAEDGEAVGVTASSLEKVLDVIKNCPTGAVYYHDNTRE